MTRRIGSPDARPAEGARHLADSFHNERTEIGMSLDPEQVRGAIRAKVIELARGLGMDASELTDDEIIPATGYLDSAAILELLVWYETEYDLPLAQDDINIDNLGSVDSMVSFLFAQKQA